MSLKSQNDKNNDANEFKENNSVFWSDTLNKRKKSYCKCLQNERKSKLYEKWIEDYPQYLPLKYRPRLNPSDSPVLVQQKLASSRQKYVDDIDLMKRYV